MTQNPPSKPKGRILPFRRPGMRLKPKATPAPPIADLAQYERRPDEPDDYRHRMKMNALALIVTVALIVAGIWMADVIARMRKNQDCVLSGRPGCTPVEVPSRPR